MIHASSWQGFSRPVSSLMTLLVPEELQSPRDEGELQVSYTSAVSAPAIGLFCVAALPLSLLVQLDQ